MNHIIIIIIIIIIITIIIITSWMPMFHYGEYAFIKVN